MAPHVLAITVESFTGSVIAKYLTIQPVRQHLDAERVESRLLAIGLWLVCPRLVVAGRRSKAGLGLHVQGCVELGQGQLGQRAADWLCRAKRGDHDEESTCQAESMRSSQIGLIIRSDKETIRQSLHIVGTFDLAREIARW